MSTTTVQRHCPVCGQYRLFAKQGPSHILHLLLSLVTLGMWLPVWFLCVLLSAFEPFRCMACGQGRLV